MGAFGDKFRTERERRGFTLDDVSNVTKINSRMLKAIEDEHFDLLPGGVFNKGFVRAYAKHLGFNDEESVTEYLAALRHAQVQAQTAAWQLDLPPQTHAEPVRAEQGQAGRLRTEQVRAEKVSVGPTPNPAVGKVSPNKTVPAKVNPEVPQPRHETRQNSLPAQKVPSATVPPVATAPQKYPPAELDLGGIAPRTDSFPWKVPAVVVLVILVAALLWNRHSHGVHADGATSPHPESRLAAANNSAETTPAPAPPDAVAASPSSLPNPAPPSGPKGTTNLDRASSPATAAAAREHDAAPTQPAPAVADHPIADRAVLHHSADQDVTVRKLTPVVPAANAPPVFTLRIRASESSWIAVTADGQPIVHETLIAPASTSIRATREITVRVGNAAGVSFLVNGKEIPPQGNEAEVKTLTFDSQGMKEPARAQEPDPAH